MAKHAFLWRLGQLELEKSRFLDKDLRFLRFFKVLFLIFFRFQCMKTEQKSMAQKFTKNISYMIHLFSCHIIYS